MESGGKKRKRNKVGELKEVKTNQLTKNSSCDDNFNDDEKWSRQQSEDREPLYNTQLGYYR